VAHAVAQVVARVSHAQEVEAVERPPRAVVANQRFDVPTDADAATSVQRATTPQVVTCAFDAQGFLS